MRDLSCRRPPPTGVAALFGTEKEKKEVSSLKPADGVFQGLGLTRTERFAATNIRLESEQQVLSV